MRVWDLDLAPGERVPFHCHDRPYFFVTVERAPRSAASPTATGDAGLPAGRHVVHEIGAGDEIHDLENVGSTRLRFTTVELLT